MYEDHGLPEWLREQLLSKNQMARNLKNQQYSSKSSWPSGIDLTHIFDPSKIPGPPIPDEPKPENMVYKGDWVQWEEKYSEGYIYIGFVLGIRNGEVLVIQTYTNDPDPAGPNGSNAYVETEKAKVLGPDKPWNYEACLDLIDLALATKDKEWFMELSGNMWGPKGIYD